jgi:hypothetical protein
MGLLHTSRYPNKVCGRKKNYDHSGLLSRTPRHDKESQHHDAQPTGRNHTERLAVSGHPKRKKMRSALLLRAEQQLGENTTAIDYVVSWVAGGRSVKALSESLQEEIGESVSRNFLSFIVHRLSPDATRLIATARFRARSARAAAPGERHPAVAKSVYHVAPPSDDR